MKNVQPKYNSLGTWVQPDEPASPDWSGTENYNIAPDSADHYGSDYPTYPGTQRWVELTFHNCKTHIGCAGDPIAPSPKGGYTNELGDSIKIVRQGGEINYKICGIGLSPKYQTNTDGSIVYNGNDPVPAKGLVIPDCTGGHQTALFMVTCFDNPVDGTYSNIVEVAYIDSAKPNNSSPYKIDPTH
jgi:hypothetical protein